MNPATDSRSQHKRKGTLAMTKLLKALIAGLTLFGALSASSIAADSGASMVEQNAAEQARLERAGFPQYAQ
jgi:hypothetical protein